MFFIFPAAFTSAIIILRLHYGIKSLFLTMQKVAIDLLSLFGYAIVSMFAFPKFGYVKSEKFPEKYLLLSVALRCVILSLVIGTYNRGYMVQPSARDSPKFFFHFVPEKLRIPQRQSLSQQIFKPHLIF